MNLNDWLKQATQEERELLANQCETTTAYLYQIAGGHRAGSAVLARKIEEQTTAISPDRVVSKNLLRPDVFGEVAA